VAILELRDVVFRYPGTARQAIAGIDLAIEPGEIVGVVGPNDAGKSTLCLVASGLAPSSTGGEMTGRVHIEGAAGIVFQDPATQRSGVTGTVFEEVAVGPVNLGRPVPETVAAVRSALRAVGIEDLAERHPAHLSGGQQQQLAIGRALVMRPKLLVLDEPTEGIQPSIIKDIERAIRALAATGEMSILLVEQYYDFARSLADQYLVMERGEIIARGAGADMDRDNIRALLAV